MANGNSATGEAWHLPASMLSVLWADVFPRVLAKTWQKQRKDRWRWFNNHAYSYKTRNYLEIMDLSQGTLFDAAKRALDDRETFGAREKTEDRVIEYENRYQENLKKELREWIRELAVLAGEDEASVMAPADDPSSWQAEATDLTRIEPDHEPRFNSEFGRKAKLLHDYLGLESSVPIRIIDDEAYDFVLSNEGVDLFKPKPPTKAEELLQRYTVRETGNFPVSLPSLFGPQAHGGNGANGAHDGVSPGRIDLIQMEGPTNPSLVIKRPASQDKQESDELFRARLLSREMRETSDNFWQIPGSILRSVQYDLPKVVATIMYHREGNRGDVDENGKPLRDRYGNYEGRYSQLKGLREIFEERLEVSLPPVAQMYYFGPLSAARANRPDDLWGWDEEQINITDQGLVFPELRAPDLELSLDDMLQVISKGAAGNPVITGTH